MRKPCPLTLRQIDVLRLYARGLSLKEIAAALDIRHSTVATHLDRARQLSRARSNISLVVTAVHLGWIERVSK
jgi:two-component system, NarL family, captular synthesis response regulator RcsB